MRAELNKRMKKLVQPNPFIPCGMSATWIKPMLTCRVTAKEWSESHKLVRPDVRGIAERHFGKAVSGLPGWASRSRLTAECRFDSAVVNSGLSMSALPPSRFFPPAQRANRWGLVLIGGELSPDWLLDAYRHGIFPWPLLDDCPEVQWWSPDPRAIFELDGFHISRRLAATLRSGKFNVTSDRDFAGVIQGCATAADRDRQAPG